MFVADRMKVVPAAVAIGVYLLFVTVCPAQDSPAFVDAVDVQLIMPEPNGVQARAEAEVNAAGTVTALKLTVPGSGYAVVPWIRIDPPPGVGATPIATPVLKDGSLVEVKIENGGAGYQVRNPPGVFIASPDRRAVARAVLTPDTLTGLEIIDPGTGYVIPSKARHPIIDTHGWSGGMSVWINGIIRMATSRGSASVCWMPLAKSKPPELSANWRNWPKARLPVPIPGTSM